MTHESDVPMSVSRVTVSVHTIYKFLVYIYVLYAL